MLRKHEYRQTKSQVWYRVLSPLSISSMCDPLPLSSENHPRHPLSQFACTIRHKFPLKASVLASRATASICHTSSPSRLFDISTTFTYSLSYTPPSHQNATRHPTPQRPAPPAFLPHNLPQTPPRSHLRLRPRLFRTHRRDMPLVILSEPNSLVRHVLGVGDLFILQRHVF